MNKPPLTYPSNISLNTILGDLSTAFARRGVECQRVDTHISSVLLAGLDVYKFKKPVDFGFVDFSTAVKREHFCQREVALNRRFAPELYRGVVPVSYVDNQAILNDFASPAIESAVWMRRFDRAQQLDALLDAQALTPADFDALGTSLGVAHDSAARAEPQYGTAARSYAQMAAVVTPLLAAAPEQHSLLASFRLRLTADHDLLAARHEQGFIRDCHGDLHTANIVRMPDHRWLAFDCIEFNDELRFIDTLSDMAFLLMDLDFRPAREYSNRALNAYLAERGDYTGLPLLPLYCAYRALVRALVAELARQQATKPNQKDLIARRDAYIALAGDYLLKPTPPRLVITHGLAGSGKTWRSRALAATQGWITLRSDVERRRLSSAPRLGTTSSGLKEGLYTESNSAQTYRHLAKLASEVIRAGYSVIVDATFLKQTSREHFRNLAQSLEVPFEIIDCEAPLPLLKQRVTTRQARRDDASEATLAVLDEQLKQREPLTADELQFIRRDNA